MYLVIYKKAALKGMKKMPKETKESMVTAFDKLSIDPDRQDFDVKKLTGREGYRLRIGQWRAIYHRDNGKLVLLVVNAGPRGDIYK
ncbi:MAG: type II toxin-antitoxin system RelE/ParE family toxin [Pseudomonadota bacterium]